MKTTRILGLLTMTLCLGGCGAAAEGDEFELEDVDSLGQALNMYCGDTSPDLTFSSSYRGSTGIKNGFGSFDFKSNYNSCTKGFFVQVDSWKEVTPGRVSKVVFDGKGISQSECPNIDVRLYVWVQQAGKFGFRDVVTNHGKWSSKFGCEAYLDKNAMHWLEGSLSQGDVVKYAVTARRADGVTTLPVKMTQTADLLRQ